MSKLEKNVLGAVGFIYLTRRIFSAYALKTYAVFFSCAGLLLLVSVPHVMANFINAESAGLPTLGAFLFAAITKTSVVVQALLVLATASLVWLGTDLVRQSESRQYA